MSHLTKFRIFWKPFSCFFSNIKCSTHVFFQYKMRYLVVNKKKNPLFVWGWDSKICPLWSLFVITRQASSGWIFLSHPHTHDGFLLGHIIDKINKGCHLFFNHDKQIVGKLSILVLYKDVLAFSISLSKFYLKVICFPQIFLPALSNGPLFSEDCVSSKEFNLFPSIWADIRKYLLMKMIKGPY